MKFTEHFQRLLSILKEKLYGSFLWKTVEPGRFIRLFLLLFTVLMLIWALIVFIIDPYMFWHRSFCLQQTYPETYAMIPSVLRHCDYDTVIVGSSLTKNFRISDANTLLKTRTIKATAPGAHGDDWLSFMHEALSAGKVKRFLVCVDTWAFLRKDKRSNHSRYHYMYGKRNCFPYLFSLDTLEAIGDVLQVNLFMRGPQREFELNFDYIFFDPFWRYEYSRKAVEKDIRHKYIPPPKAETAPYPFYEKYLFSVVKAHPEIRFDLFFAPCSIWMWCGIEEQGDLERYLTARKEIAEICAKYPHVYLHDLQANAEIVCDLENYKDITHYSPKINRWILEQIAGKPDGDTLQDIIANNEKLRTLVKKHKPDFLSVLSQSTPRRK